MSKLEILKTSWTDCHIYIDAYGRTRKDNKKSSHTTRNPLPDTRSRIRDVMQIRRQPGGWQDCQAKDNLYALSTMGNTVSWTHLVCLMHWTTVEWGCLAVMRLLALIVRSLLRLPLGHARAKTMVTPCVDGGVQGCNASRPCPISTAIELTRQTSDITRIQVLFVTTEARRLVMMKIRGNRNQCRPQSPLEYPISYLVFMYRSPYE